jgi:apolipoprotein D and lipocalin family protein
VRRAGLVAACLLLAACATTTSRRGLPPPATVERVDLGRYAGTWYEIASFPTRFQRGCTATQATYTPRPDGTIGVVNSCRKGGLDGPVDRIEGTAWPVDPPADARLKVRFFWPLTGDYWVLALGPEYRWALVGHPSRDYLWILSRTPRLDAADWDAAVAHAAADGFDTSRLVRTPQPD